MTPKTVNKIFSVFADEQPNPTTELVYNSNFELLIAVILSAQATDISVNLATKELYKVANTPEQILKLGLTKLKKYVKSIGLYNTKAENIIKTCKILFEQHSSKVPNTRKELEALPGVGRKTANVILNTAYKIPTIAVDTHIFRVSNRIGLCNSSTPLATEEALLKIIPNKYKLNAHHWLILHGRYTCTARKPKCGECKIYKLCKYDSKT